MRAAPLAALLVLLGACGATPRSQAPAVAAPELAELPAHPALLAPLTADSVFPRFAPAELAAAGYPDHKHVHGYPGYRPFRDAQGESYGPFSLARGTLVIPRDGLEITPGEVRYRGLRATFPPGVPDHHMLPLVEMLDWARRDLARLLDHDLPDTLVVHSPQDLDEYRELTGYGFHRLYRDHGAEVIVEPADVLYARGLAAHAAFHLVAARLVRDLAGGAALPAWLVDGLASYLAEDGNHFLSYVERYRDQLPIVHAPGDAEAILAGAPHEDEGTDLYRIRTAGYTAFLMAWELVEYRGGLRAVSGLLRAVGSGMALDDACRKHYGLDLAGLTAALDPTGRAEPVGDATGPRRPHLPPSS